MDEPVVSFSEGTSIVTAQVPLEASCVVASWPGPLSAVPLQPDVTQRLDTIAAVYAARRAERADATGVSP